MREKMQLLSTKYVLCILHNSLHLVLMVAIKPTPSQLHLHLTTLEFVCTLPELVPTIYGLRPRNHLAESRLKFGSGFLNLLCSHHTLFPKKVSEKYEPDFYLFKKALAGF